MNDFDDQQDGQQNDTGSQAEQLIVRHDFTIQAALNADKLAAIAARLDALPSRQQPTLADAIKTLAPTVKRLRARGYTVDEVAAELSASGLQVSGRTLSRLTASAKPAKRSSAGHA